MSTKTLRPWTEFVRLHPDVEAGEFTDSLFAIDLGAIHAQDPNIPVVNRDARAFFRATYLTADLAKLLEEVLASLAGKPGYNRVLKLRTPFGGGKSHTLAALLHAVRDRKALSTIPEAKGFADPGEVAVAVFDGEKFDARNGKTVEGRHIRTMWGWIAWQIDPKRAYPLVEGHDQDRVTPAGDVIQEMLTAGAGGRPVLILLDEVLKYMEGASAVAVQESTLQRQAKSFFQNLTVEIPRTKNGALVYSLVWSSKEAGGNVALLSEIDKLASREDQLREPVSGDEVIHVIHRRLLESAPDEKMASKVAEAYSEEFIHMRRAMANTPAEKQQAEEEGLQYLNRMKISYPLHPALTDIMRERWAAVDAFQRTRGALKFLASCMHSTKKSGNAGAILGPADIPLVDSAVRIRLLKELGAQNDYDPVITADIEGPNGRAKKIDDRLGKENPALANLKPARRLATALLLYSFGGLRREGGSEGETLPSGVTESELLASVVSPDLDRMTASAILGELRRTCLYLHFDGTRYCFKKDPNVTKLIEDAEQEVTREEAHGKGEGPVRGRIKQMLEERLAGHRSDFIWQDKSMDIPDKEPHFLLDFLPLEFAGLAKKDQERQAIDLFSNYGNHPRLYRNGVGLVIPDKKQLEPLQRAVRYLIATERVEARKAQYHLSKEHSDQLKERQRTEKTAAEAALRDLYNAVWLPRVENGSLGIERVEVGGRPLQATGIHERVMELLTSVGTPKVHSTLKARKIIDRVKMGDSPSPGEPLRLGIKASDVRDAFFCILEPPRLESDLAIKKAITQGIMEGMFAYTSGAIPVLGADGKFQVNLDKVVFKRSLSEDEVDFDSGFLMIPSAVPAAPQPQQPAATPAGTPPMPGGLPGTTGAGAGPGVPEPTGAATLPKKVVQLVFSATRDQIFKVFPAIANLADKSDGSKVTIRVEGTSEKGYDPNWLRNAVEEPLDEADVNKQPAGI